MNELTSLEPKVATKAFTPITEDEMAKHLVNLRAKLLKYASINFRVSDDVAEDLIGEVSYKALRSRKNYNPEKGKITTFLYRVLTNTYIDSTRGGKKKFNDSLISNEFIGKEGTTLMYDGEVAPEDLGSKYYCEILMNAIDLLPEKLGKVMRRIADGSQLDEIAKELNLPIGTVKARSNIARKTMAHSLVSIGLVDVASLGRSAYMLNGGARIVAKKSVDKHAMQVSQMAQAHLLKANNVSF